MSTRLTLSARDRRTLTRGAVMIGAIVALGRGLPAWKRWDTDTRFRATEASHDAAVAVAGIRQLTAIRDSVAARTKRLDDLAPQLFEYKTTDEASAALAILVSDYADEAAVKVSSTQPRPTTGFSATRFTRIGVRVNATADVEGLMSLLSALEGGTKLVSVRELTVTQPEPAAPDDRPEALRFELVVEGLAMRSREAGQ
jgi:hypothetical protein